MVPRRGFVLSVVLSVLFVSVTAKARSLRVAASGNESDHHQQKAMDYKFQSSQDGALDYGTEDLNAMDYTPAKRRPPIHN
ncbi:uncharacterized protein LOC126798323 [Argentina anserina]|uniref:uncharacterized protein LOC126798323 n=1 Tax=Argentina anserina TaxID=57926 RepID=UPI0021766594|nr:uncharacterized protein LOC126798323 [Potentilla anserina]